MHSILGNGRVWFDYLGLRGFTKDVMPMLMHFFESSTFKSLIVFSLDLAQPTGGKLALAATLGVVLSHAKHTAP
jgi:hypothetical protein